MNADRSSARPASADADERLRSLQMTGDLIWNTSSRVTRRRRGSDPRLVVVPSAARPRLAVPAGRPRAAAAAVLAHGESDTRAARRQRWLLALALRTGLGAQLFRTGLELDGAPGPNLLTHLEHVLGEPVWPSIALTPRRANRKPVLQLHDRRGRPVAFVKVGITPLTRELVRHEAAVLAHLAEQSFRTLQPPQIMHAGRWEDLELLVLAPLPTRRASEATGGTLTAAMRELADLGRADPAAPTTTSYVQALRARSSTARRAMPAEDEVVVNEMLDHADKLAADPAAARIGFGWWHGDWTPWNCREHRDRLMVWDWERCAAQVPMGFDAAHHYIQKSAVRDRVPRRDAAANCVDRAGELLRPWGLDDAAGRVVVGLYLAEIGVRYLSDAQHRVGGPGGDVSAWALPALRSLTTEGKVRSDAE